MGKIKSSAVALFRRLVPSGGEEPSASPEPVDIDPGYAAKLEVERLFFEDNIQVHDLPPIFHYWSNKYIRPMHEEFGFTMAEDMYTKYLSRAAGTCGGKTPIFVSLGSGNCDLEIRVVQMLKAAGLSQFVIECVDLNPSMLERGRELAEVAGLQQHLEFAPCDFNHWKATRKYACVIAHQSLHHVWELESLFDEIKKSLLPQGYFLTSDMIGRNGHLRWPEAMREVQRFWRELPPEYRWNTVLERAEEEYLDHDCSTEGFEGIRAQDILPLLVKRFDFELFIPFGNVIQPFIDRRFGPHFDIQREWDRDFIDRVHALDEQALLSRRVSPCQMLAAMTPQPCRERHYSRGLTPSRCVRREVHTADELAATERSAPISILTTSMRPAAPQGFIYSIQFEAGDGILPYEWSAVGLPPGLVLDTSGLLSGRVRSAGVFNPIVTVNDSAHPPQVAAQRYTVIIKDLPEPLAIAAWTRCGAVAESPYRESLKATGGSPPYRWAVTEGALPGGLVLDESAGVIEGQIVETATAPFVLRVTDAGLDSATIRKTMLIHPQRVAYARLVLSHFVCGGGWKTSLLLKNPSSSSTSIAIRFFSDDGSPLSLPVTVAARAITTAEIEEIIAPHSSVHIETLGQVGPDLAGWAEIRYIGSLLAEVTFAHTVFGRATAMVEEAFASSFLRIPYVHSDGSSTGIGLANVDHSAAATVAVAVRNQHGEHAAAEHIELPPGGHTSFSLVDRFPAAAGQNGVVEFECSTGQEIASLGLRFFPDQQFKFVQ